MSHYRRASLAGLLSLTFLVAIPNAAFALAGLLTHPGVAISANSGLKSNEVQKVLANPKFKYVTGSFINSFTTLFYSGSTDNLEEFLDDLSQLKGAKVSLTFSMKHGVADTTWFGKTGKKASCQWRVSHHRDQFGVTVYLGDGKIKRGDLDIPSGVKRPANENPKAPSLDTRR